MQTTPSQHPSRSAPLCKDCKHLLREQRSASRCAHPRAEVDLVYGYPVRWAEHMRTDDRYCGHEAAWFERSPSAGCTTCHGSGTRLELIDGKSQKVSCPACLMAPMAVATATTTAGATGSANRA